MIKPVEINLHLRRPSLYTRLSAKIVKALPSEYLPIINTAADIVGRIMTSKPIEYGMMALFGRAYELGRARRLAGGKDALKLPLSFFSWPGKLDPTFRPSFNPIEIAAYEQHLNGYQINWNKMLTATKRQRLWDRGKQAGGLTAGSKTSDTFPLKYFQGSAQIEMKQFEDGVRKMIERLISATTGPSEQKMKEHLSMAIELADGTLIPMVETACSGEEFSCALPNNYKELEREAITKATYPALDDLRLKTGTVKIYHLHTHPEVEDMYIGKDAEGTPFTELSRDDYTQSELPVFYNLVRRLRALGFIGTIEIVMGAVPALADGQNSRLKIATYTERVTDQNSFKIRAA